jgi:WD40 repeat protein
MAFAALAKRAKAASAAEPAFESSRDSSHESAALHHANQTLLDNKELSKSDANGLPLPTVGSALPEHPSTKPRPASKSSAPKQDSALLQKIREQIAKEEAEEKLSQANSSVPQPDSSPPTLPLHLRTKEGTESTGNTDCVNCFTLFCNGEFASGSGDGRVLIWNEGTGEVIQVLQNHHGPVLSMTTDSTGRKLVTGSSDMSMKKWDLTRPVISQDLEFIGHNRWVQSVAVHGHFVFSASLDKTVRQWDLHSGKCNFIFAGHSDWVSSLCVHQETLYTGSWDGFVRLWNVSTWECTYLFEGHKGPVLAICLDVKEAHQKPSFIYSASQDGSVKRWSLKDHVESNTYSGHILGVSSIDCSSKLLASGSFDSTIRLYDLESHDVKAVDPCHVLHGHEDSVTCIKLSKDDLYLYSSSDDFTIRKWDCKTGLCLRIYGIPRSQQLIGGLGSASKASGSLSLLLNFGDDDDPTSLRARIRRILREEENESVLLEHEYSRRLEMYRNRLQADHLKESKGQKKNDGSVQPGDDGFEDSVIIDLKDDFLNQRYELIAVYSDAKEALREDVLDCAGLGVTAVQLLWENKQEGLKVAWLESKFKSSSSTVQTAASEVSELDSSDGVAKVAASSILNEVLCGVLSHTAECVSEDILKEIVDSILIKQTPQDIAEDILKGIMDLVCITHPSTAAIVAPMPSFQKPVFDASSAKIDVSDVTLADVLSPQLLACLNSILHRANRRYNRSKAVFNTKFFESAMTQADQRDCRLQILQAGILDREERKMLLQQEETRILALISGEAREIHTILTQVASEIDRLISDHRQLWLFKFSGLFTDSQWNELDSAVADLIRKHQLKSDALYEEFDVFFLDATSKDLPLSAIEERCEQLNRDMADLQKSLDEELIQVLMTLHFVTPELLAQLRTIFGRDAGSVMLQFRLEVDRQQKRAVDEALERARQEDIQKEEIARLIAKREFKEKRKREVEAAKLAKIEAMKALESSRMKQKREFELTLGESAKSEDFSDLDDSFFVFLHRYDLRRRPVLILKMANFPPDPCLDGRPQHEDFEYLSEDWQQRVMRYVILKLDSILDAPYSTHGDASRYLLVVDFTDSSSSRRPSIVFLHQAWHILPDRARSLMDECVIIDSPFWFRAFVWYLKPLVSPRVWKKVRFIKSYSDLWGTLSHSDLCNISSTDKYGNKKVAFSGGTSDISGKPSFLSMLSRARTAHLIKGQDSLEFFEKYFEIINGAKVADWSEIIDLHFLDTTGVDILGRPVIMFIASNFTCKLGDSFLNRCLVYIMLKVHELMFEQKKHVSILVVCSNITTQNIPSTTWLSAAAKKFPYRIRKMIQCIYILNPGFLVKKVLWALRSIVSPKIANKIIEVETILQLLRYFNHSDLKLPPSVLQDVPFGGTPEEMKMMMAEIRAAMKRGIDAGLDQTVDFSQQFKRGLKAPSDHDIETFFTITYKDFEDINGKDIVKFAGRDLAKRPMVSITLANIPAAKGEIVMNKLFRLVVLLLQPLSQLPYSIAVIATRFAAANSPAIEWMRDIHKSIDSSARKNLRAVYMFEPTFLIKSVTFGLQQFISSKFFKKVFLVRCFVVVTCYFLQPSLFSSIVYQITDSDDFYQHIDPNHCKLPKSLISQFVRAPAPVAPLKESAPSAAVVPPQFAAISSSRFVGETVLLSALYFRLCQSHFFRITISQAR